MYHRCFHIQIATHCLKHEGRYQKTHPKICNVHASVYIDMKTHMASVVGPAPMLYQIQQLILSHPPDQANTLVNKNLAVQHSGRAQAEDNSVTTTATLQHS